MPEPITITAITLKVADTITDDYISKGFEKYIAKPVLEYFKDPETLKEHLRIAVEKTCSDLEKKYGSGTNEEGKFPFYQSAAVLTELLKFRQFDDFDDNRFKQVFFDHPLIINPSQDQIKYFFEVFEKFINEDEKLRQLEIEETYKEKIFQIDNCLKTLSREIKSEFQRTINQIDRSLQVEYKEELKQFEKNIHDFKPKSALEHLETLESRIDNSQKQNQRTISQLQYLKGICYRELHDNLKKAECYINSYTLDQTNLTYKSLAAIAYLEQDLPEKSVVLAKEVLEENEFDTRSWVVLLKTKNATLENIPKSVKNDPEFKILYSSYVLTNSEMNANSDTHKMFEKELNSLEVPAEITFENKSFWMTILKLRQEAFADKITFSYTFQLPEEISEDPDLLNAYHILERFHDKLVNSELLDTYVDLVFFYKHYGYLVKGDKKSAFELYQFFNQLNKKKHHALATVFALSQTGQFDYALDIIENASESDLTNYLIGMQICLHQNHQNDAANYSNIFFSKIDEINETTLENTLMHLDLFCKTQKDKEAFLAGLRDRNVKINEIDETILAIFLLVLSKDNEKIPEIEQNLSSILPQIEKDDHIRLRIISNIYSLIHDYEKANKILEPLIDKSKPSVFLTFYIENLYLSKKNNEELLDLLEIERSSSINMRFLLWEIEVAKYIPDWQRIEKVTKIGNEHFPDNVNFITFHLIALQQLSKESEVKEYLKKIEESIFPEDHAFSIANICILNKEFDLALRLIYPLALDSNNIKAREYYNFTIGLQLPGNYFPKLRKVEKDCCAIVLIDGEEKTYLINRTGIKGNKLIQMLNGKTLHEKFTYEGNLPGKIHEAEVIDIIQKEKALFKEINDEISNSPDGSYSAAPIQWEGGVQGMLDKMVELFGAKEEERTRKINELLLSYNEGNLSFSEVVNNVFHGKALDAYHSLTSPQNSCFRIIPIFHYRNIKLEEDTEIVIDLSTLPLLYELAEEHGITNSKRFIISQYVYEFLDQLVYETQQMSDRPASITIKANKALPNFYPENFKENRLKYLSNLISWCKKNCTTRLVKEKLDVIAEFRANHEEVNSYFEYIIDTAFLSNKENHILVSDDMLFLTLRNLQSGKMVSSEFYLKANHSDDFIGEIMPVLLNKNYIGLTINSQILFSEYNNRVKDKDRFLKCLANLPFSINRNPKTIPECIDFIKKVYLTPSLPEERHWISTMTFVHVLKGIDLTPFRLTLIKGMINESFKLLGMHLDSVLQDLEDALKILRK